MQNKDTCSAVCRLKLLSIMMMFVFDNELGILSVRIQIQKKKNKHSSMRWLQIEDGDWGGTAETKHETRAECWVPEWSLVIHSRVIVTDHQVLESVVCMDQDLCRVMEFSSSSRSALSRDNICLVTICHIKFVWFITDMVFAPQVLHVNFARLANLV